MCAWTRRENGVLGFRVLRFRDFDFRASRSKESRMITGHMT